MKQGMRWVVVVGLCLASAAGFAQALDIEGVKFDATAQVGDKTLVLNGAGLRTRVFFKVYAAGLYVPEKSNNAATVLAQQGPRLVRLDLLRKVHAESFVQALNEGLKNNHTEQQLAAFKAQMDTLNATLKTMGEVKKGDRVLFEFAPQTGLRVILNGQPQGAAIADEAFFTAVLRVWIGEHPAENDLKKGLLGL